MPMASFLVDVLLVYIVLVTLQNSSWMPIFNYLYISTTPTMLPQVGYHVENALTPC